MGVYCHFLFRTFQHGSCSWTYVRTGTVGSRSFSLGQANWAVQLYYPVLPTQISLLITFSYSFSKYEYTVGNIVDPYSVVSLWFNLMHDFILFRSIFKATDLLITSRDWRNSVRLHTLYGYWANAYNNAMYFILKVQAWKSLRLLIKGKWGADSSFSFQPFMVFHVVLG